MAWNAAVPAGTDAIRDGDNVIRELKTDLATALTAYGHFPINAAAPKFQYKGQRGATGSRPTNGEGGIYFDTTTNEILHDDGAAWQKVGVTFPATTALCFFQAAAPAGWTKQTAQNDKFLRVTSGSGGGSGGSWSTLGHSHSLSNSGYAKVWISYFDATTNLEFYIDEVSASSYSNDIQTRSFAQTDALLGGSSTKGAGLGGSTDSATISHGSSQHAYVDVIICTKD